MVDEMLKEMLRQQYEGFAHIAVYTGNLDESIAFYEAIGAALQMRSRYQDEQGVKNLVLLTLAGFSIELIESSVPGEMKFQEGVIPHFSIWVKDMTATAGILKQIPCVEFLTSERAILPHIFGGVHNWYIKGPSGELIELLQKI